MDRYRYKDRLNQVFYCIDPLELCDEDIGWIEISPMSLKLLITIENVSI